MYVSCDLLDSSKLDKRGLVTSCELVDDNDVVRGD